MRLDLIKSLLDTEGTIIVRRKEQALYLFTGIK